MNSLGSLPVFFLAFSISWGSNLRLQLAISTVPLERAAMPVPDPPPETSTETVGSTLAYSSAHAWARFTMVSDPVSWIMVLPLFASLEREQPEEITMVDSKASATPARIARRQRGPDGNWNWKLMMVV